MRLSQRAGTPGRPLEEPHLEVAQRAKYLDALLCPSCGQALPSDAKFCPYDGRDLTEDAVRDSCQHSGTREIQTAGDSLVGWVIDERYEVLQLLGEGGMGCVYRVRHRVLGRQFALKALRPELARDEVLAQRFVQEARAAAAISHPNVVSITDFGMLDRGQPYFVMELLEGRTLGSVLRARTTLEPEQVILVASSVASALAAAHAVGVIHRDLKPDNIILLGDANTPAKLKVLDFGLAQLLGQSRLTQDDIVYGTPQYMSPEQAAGEPLDPRVDVYALGILMYEMLTGRVPFEADTYMGVLTKQIYVEPAPPTSICQALERCPGLEQVVLRCLSKDRMARYSGMSELVEALEELGVDEVAGRMAYFASARNMTPESPTIGRRRVSRKKPRPRWWVYTWGGVAALGLALGILFGRLSGGFNAPRGSKTPAVEMRREPIDAKIHAILPRSERQLERSAVQALGEDGSIQIRRPPVSTEITRLRARRKSERLSGQSQQQSRTGDANGAAPTSFGDKSTRGSSEIANPWAE